MHEESICVIRGAWDAHNLINTKSNLGFQKQTVKDIYYHLTMNNIEMNIDAFKKTENLQYLNLIHILRIGGFKK